MKAKISTRIIKEGRTKLETVIPLKQPLIIFVDPASLCNFQCEFCANGDREIIKKTGRYQGTMDMDVYKKLIDEVATYPNKTKVLRLYKEGEPLIHPQIGEMISYAKATNKFEMIDMTTNGALLTREKVHEIIDAGLDRINISVEAINGEDYKRITKANIDFKKYVEQIRYLYEHKKQCTILVKVIGDYLPEGGKEKFYEIFGDICDLIAVENLSNCWSEYDLSKFSIKENEGIYGQKLEAEAAVCPYIFYSITVNADGSVSACFLDWAHKMIVGDIREQTFCDIWNGQLMNDMRKLHLKKCRYKHAVCKSCDQLKFGSPDNIDKFADELLKKM